MQKVVVLLHYYQPVALKIPPSLLFFPEPVGDFKIIFFSPETAKNFFALSNNSSIAFF